jgi:hypothetical protein
MGRWLGRLGERGRREVWANGKGRGQRSGGVVAKRIRATTGAKDKATEAGKGDDEAKGEQ